jgi:hypothetical protein
VAAIHILAGKDMPPPKSSDDDRSAGSSRLQMDKLLQAAGVHDDTLQSIQEDSRGALISWLLYAASERGRGIVDLIGHVVNRLRNDLSKGAGGSYDELAGMGRNELGELVSRELAYGTSSFSSDHWR